MRRHHLALICGMVVGVAVLLSGCGGGGPQSNVAAPPGTADLATLSFVFMWPQPDEVDTAVIPDGTARIVVVVEEAATYDEIARGEVTQDEVIDGRAELALRVPPGDINIEVTGYSDGGRRTAIAHEWGLTVVAGEVNQFTISPTLRCILGLGPDLLSFPVTVSERTLRIWAYSGEPGVDSAGWELSADQPWVVLDLSLIHI